MDHINQRNNSHHVINGLIENYKSMYYSPEWKEIIDKDKTLDRNRAILIKNELYPLLIMFFEGNCSLTEFKSRIDSINKKNNNPWGFSGIKGQMFFNLLVKNADNESNCASILKYALKVPQDNYGAKDKILQLEQYIDEIKLRLKKYNISSHTIPSKSSIPLFLSYFWQIQAPQIWPIMYTTSVQAMRSLNLWRNTRNIFEDYISYKQTIEELCVHFKTTIIDNKLYTIEHIFWHYVQENKQNYIRYASIKKLTDRKRKALPIEISEPFDPKTISIDSRKLVVQLIINRLEQGSIRLAPKFQRKEVWNTKQKSRLIESMLLNIPLPMFYVAADERANFDVVDGMQRLTAIRDFIFDKSVGISAPTGNGFRLVGLEFIKDLEGMSFNELDQFYKNRILETELSFTIINPKTPESVKFTIFSRVNTGGLALTDQEVRHALYNGQSTVLLAELSESRIFREVTQDSFRRDRMEDREVILRVLSFMIRNYTEYPGLGGKLSDFLSETMLIINSMPEFNLPRLNKLFTKNQIKSFKYSDIKILNDDFKKSMVRVFELFDEHAFRTSLPGEKRKRINKALMDVWGSILADMTDDKFKKILDNKKHFILEYTKILQSDDFIGSISRYASKTKGAHYRHLTLTRWIRKFLSE